MNADWTFILFAAKGLEFFLIGCSLSSSISFISLTMYINEEIVQNAKNVIINDG